ncbi:MAG: hypothetical protein AABY11_03490, partial [archaeon]
ENVALCGDAAALADPLLGNSLGNALHSGMILGEELSKMGSESRPISLNTYASRVHAEVFPHIRSSSALRSWSGNAFALDWAIRRLASKPSFESHWKAWRENPSHRGAMVTPFNMVKELLI